MQNQFYLPILKSKLGEFTALSKLDERAKNFTVPLFEITPQEWDQTERKIPRTINEHLDSFCKKITRWPIANSFIDPSLLNWNGVDNTGKIEYVFDQLSKKMKLPIPVVCSNSTEEFFRSLNQILQKHPISEIGLRVTPGDVTDPIFDLNILSLLKKINIPIEGTHLIFDLKGANFSDVDGITESINGILEGFPFFDKWKSFTIAGTAFPSSREIKEGVSYFNRNEWKFYKQLTKQLKNEKYARDINYGDYSIVDPEYFEFNPKVMKASANIRYTHDDKWIVAKGKALKDASSYSQYTTLARNIYGSGFFLGPTFSNGDAHLIKCATGKEKPGAPSIWNWVGNNHHFTKVVNDLLASSLAA